MILKEQHSELDYCGLVIYIESWNNLHFINENFNNLSFCKIPNHKSYYVNKNFKIPD